MKRTRGYSRAFKAHGTTGKRYLLGNVPMKLWRAAQIRARRDGLSMRATILHLLAMYADEEVTIHADAPFPYTTRAAHDAARTTTETAKVHTS